MADVGGTHARFALIDAVTGSELGRRDYDTPAFAAGIDLVAQAVADFAVAPAVCALALAGPVEPGALTDRTGALTNGGQRFDALALRARFGGDFLLINDFVALAMAIDADTAVTAIGDLQLARPGVRAVVGPGTGLGMAYLVPSANSDEFEVYASEGGNADFAPVDELEQEVLALLRPQLGTVRVESLVSGQGLVNLYAAVSALWGSPVEHFEPAEITAAALAAEPVSHQCLSMFCGMLGTAAGNFALATGARGGVYLAGGILPRIRPFFLESEFRSRFEARGPLSGFTEQIPTFLLDEEELGLKGAARKARQFVGAPPPTKR